VLLVDDTPANLIALSAALEPIGAELVEAQSGHQAIELVAANWFAAVLLDVQMPLMDGFETAARIRRMQRGKEVPIIFLTAIHREPAFVIRGYEAGAADYMTKPLDVHVLRGRVKAFVDLFRQREAERRHRLEIALDAAPAFVSVLSVPGYLCEFGNAQYRHLFAGAEIIGKSAAALGATNELIRAMDRVVVTGEPYALDEFVLTLPNDAARTTSRIVNLTLQPLRDAQNHIEAILSFAMDVTEQVEGRRALERARAKAEAANRSKDEFLAMVSHELRTPLSSILGWTSVARRKNPSPEFDHALGVIERNARAQQQLIEALLDVSRAIAGNMRLQMSATDVAEILEQVVETLRPAAEGKAVAIRVEAEDLDVIDADAIACSKCSGTSCPMPSSSRAKAGRSPSLQPATTRRRPSGSPIRARVSSRSFFLISSNPFGKPMPRQRAVRAVWVSASPSSARSSMLTVGPSWRRVRARDTALASRSSCLRAAAPSHPERLR
jgi:hypothetical protein